MLWLDKNLKNLSVTEQRICLLCRLLKIVFKVAFKVHHACQTSHTNLIQVRFEAPVPFTFKGKHCKMCASFIYLSVGHWGLRSFTLKACDWKSYIVFLSSAKSHNLFIFGELKFKGRHETREKMTALNWLVTSIGSARSVSGWCRDKIQTAVGNQYSNWLNNWQSSLKQFLTIVKTLPKRCVN